jgi:2-polyprenyl-3-methyl-5-hydroxy-6-metoxy-1,4-benzoquinol methylase
MLFPFPSLIRHVPSSGALLDVGCGYGVWSLYLAQQFPNAQIHGIDPDREKIDIARQAAREAGLSNIRFEVGTAQDAPRRPFAQVSIIDVLYLIPEPEQESFLSNAVNCLLPGGRLLLKEMSERPRWKFAWNWMEEWLAVRLLGITMGASFHFRPQAGWETLMRSMGLAVQTFRLDRGYIHPHILFVGEKP